MKSFLRRFAVRVSLVYAIVASLWIILSDSLVAIIFNEIRPAITQASLLKGLVFVVLTTLILFVVLSAQMRKRIRVENELRAAEQLYRRVVEDQSELICRYRSDFTLTFVNRNYSALFGKSPEEIIGQNILDLVLPEDRERTRASLSAINPSNPLAIAENHWILPDGTTRWFQWTDRVIVDDAGQVIEFQGVGRDITEQKIHAQSVEDVRQFLRNTLDAFPANTAVLDRDGKIIDTNSAWNRFADENGASTHFLGTNYLIVNDQITLENAKDSTAGIRAVITGQQDIFYMEYPCHSPTERRWFGMLVTPFAEPAPRRVVVAHINITDRKLAEEELEIYQEHLENLVEQRTAALRESKLRLEAILNNSPDGVLLTDAELRIQQSNASFNTLLAVQPEAEFKKSILDFIPFDDVTRVTTEIQSAITQHASKQIETRIRRADNTTFDAELSLGYIYEFGNLICMIRDITERKQAEQALNTKIDEDRQFQQYLRALHEISIELTQIGDLDEFYKHAVQQGLERLGFERLALFVYDPVQNLAVGTYGTDMSGKIRPEHDIQFTPPPGDRFFRAFESSEHFVFDETTILQDKGTPIGTGWVVVAVLRNGTQRLGWLTADNFTDQKPATKPLLEILALYGLALGTFLAHKQAANALKNSETRLRESQQMLQNVLETIPVRVFWKDKNLKFLGANRLFLQDVEVESAEAIIGRDERDLPWADDVSDQILEDVQVLTTGIPLVNHEIGVAPEDAAEDSLVMWYQSNKVPLRDNKGEIIGLLAAYTDITERKHAEQALNAKIQEEQAFQQQLRDLHEILIELTLIDSLDEFYKRAVEFGLQRLNFERMALFLYDPAQNKAYGTYGSDIHGNLRDERNSPFTPMTDGRLLRTLTSAENFIYEDSAVLYDRGVQVGEGWVAVASLRAGTRIMGWLCIDNLISQKPARKSTLEILSIYGLALGTHLARKQTDLALRQSEADLRSVMNSTSVGIFLVDRQGVIRLANQLAFEYGKLLYNKNLEMEKTNLFDLDLSNRPGVEYLFQQAFAGEHMNVELPRMTDSGQVVLDLHYDPVMTPEGEVIGVTISFIDITQRKRTEEALKQALERANELSELKSRFVSMASHEFRTPLTSILSSTEILTRYREKMDKDQIGEKLSLIARQVQHLNAIVEDVLNLGRIQSGRIEFHPREIDLGQLCQEVIMEFQNRPDFPHNIHYTPHPSPVILNLDRTLISQVIINLLTNAIKYSPEGKHVWVTLGSDSLCVRDEGIGIPPADINHLFQPFHRANNVGAISGTGLGLAIAKEAIERHGGTLTVESEVGVGSTFCVRFSAD